MAAVDALQKLCPVLSLCLFLLVLAVKLCFPSWLRHGKGVVPSGTTRRHLLICSWSIAFSFIVDTVLLFNAPDNSNRVLRSEGSNFYALAYAFLWFWLSVLLAEITNPPWLAYSLTGASTATFDCAWIIALGLHRLHGNPFEVAHLAIRILRVLLFAISGCYLLFSVGRSTNTKSAGEYGNEDEEARGLLSGDEDATIGNSTPSNPDTYGSCNAESSRTESKHHDDGEDGDRDDSEDEEEREIRKLQKKRLEEEGGWLKYLKGFLIFLPYILPYKDRITQLWLLAMLICVVLERFMTIMVPRQLGIITDALSETPNTGIVPWKDIIIWGLLNFPLRSLVELYKCIAETRMSQFAYYQLKSAAFAHVMGLSMDYHTTKSSGKLARAIEQGTDLTSIIENILTVTPMFIDLAIAAVYLAARFDFYMGFLVLGTSLAQIYAALKGSAAAFPLQRASSERSRCESEVLYDSVSNWATVAYHNRRRYEQDRFDTAVRAQVVAQRRYYDRSEYNWASQTLILDAGLVIAACIAVAKIANGQATVSGFVFLVSYWRALGDPMMRLLFTFRETSSHLINAEWLFQLLSTKPSVAEKPNAPDLSVPRGQVEFRNVSFAYDAKRPILQDLSFVAEPGQSIALVGETGGGKSTTLKLLYRFYDVTSGAITIDGQDIRDITLDSLRDCLGAVPQEPCVFDQTILQNVSYARPGATKDDVVAACKAARIHDQICRFPDGYDTRLGERGVRLSGGELQRLAIARVILRSPRIVVLDEATSAVDSGTEASVQRALGALSAGRTVFTVAHRLSTIVKADLILVIDQGRVVERGTHSELLEMEGMYHRLWAMQTASQPSKEREDLVELEDS